MFTQYVHQLLAAWNQGQIRPIPGILWVALWFGFLHGNFWEWTASWAILTLVVVPIVMAIVGLILKFLFPPLDWLSRLLGLLTWLPIIGEKGILGCLGRMIFWIPWVAIWLIVGFFRR